MGSGKTKYNKLPTKILLNDFNKYIKVHLSNPKRGPKPKISNFKFFNYILYVLHTGIQWKELKIYKNEIHWSRIYKKHCLWSRDGSYLKLFESSVAELFKLGKLDLSILHGDGSNTIAKKGARK
jgi:hypothetical protein